MAICLGLHPYIYILYAARKLLGRTVVYIPIITLSHATSRDVGSLQSDWMLWRQLVTFLRHFPLLRCLKKTNVLTFFCQKYSTLSHFFCQIKIQKECKCMYKEWTQFFWCLSKTNKWHWVTSKAHLFCMQPSKWRPMGDTYFAHDLLRSYFMNLRKMKFISYRVSQ